MPALKRCLVVHALIMLEQCSAGTRGHGAGWQLRKVARLGGEH
jgi:hypothetical protein